MDEAGVGAVALGDLIRRARARLAAGAIPDAAADARVLIGHLAGLCLRDMALDRNRPVAPCVVHAVDVALARRLGGEPVHRILGERAFHGVTLRLSPATLEPRPDTEALVDLVLPAVRMAAASEGACAVLDLGTGTGAVALALLKEEPRARAIGTDISTQALETAGANAELNGLTTRFATLKSDWFARVEGRFHAIVSNPPYIRSREIASLAREVREHDPLVALDGGDDGLDAYRRIAVGAMRHLRDSGVVAVETGFDQQADVTAIFAAAGFARRDSARDVGGRDRALLFGPRAKGDPSR